MDPDIAKMAILISAQFYKKKPSKLVNKVEKNTFTRIQNTPTEIDDWAGEGYVAAHWPLESLGSGQNPHLGVITSDVTDWTIMVLRWSVI